MDLVSRISASSNLFYISIHLAWLCFKHLSDLIIKNKMLINQILIAPYPKWKQKICKGIPYALHVYSVKIFKCLSQKQPHRKINSFSFFWARYYLLCAVCCTYNGSESSAITIMQNELSLSQPGLFVQLNFNGTYVFHTHGTHFAFFAPIYLFLVS